MTDSKRDNKLRITLLFLSLGICGCQIESGGNQLAETHPSASSTEQKPQFSAEITVTRAVGNILRELGANKIAPVDLFSPPRCLKVAFENHDTLELIGKHLSQVNNRSTEISYDTDSLEVSNGDSPFYFFNAGSKVRVLLGQIDGRNSPQILDSNTLRYLVEHEDSRTNTRELCWMRHVFLNMGELEAATREKINQDFADRHPGSGTVTFIGSLNSRVKHSYFKISPAPSSELLPSTAEMDGTRDLAMPPEGWSMARTSQHDPLKACLIGIGAKIEFASLGEERNGHILIRFGGRQGSGQGLMNDTAYRSVTLAPFFTTPAFAKHWEDVETYYALPDGTIQTAPQCAIKNEAWVFKAHFTGWP